MKWICLTIDGADLYMNANDVACVKTSMGHTTIWLSGASYFTVDQTVEEVMKRLQQAEATP